MKSTQQLPRIHCAVCDKEIEDVRVWRDVQNNGWVVHVRCHGDEDSCAVEMVDIATYGSQAYATGTAFTTKRLEKPDGDVPGRV